MEIGYKLKKLREIKKLSQQEVAHLLSISQKTYSNVENDRSSLSIENLSSISMILEFDLLELLQEQGIVYNQKSKTDSENTVFKNEYTNKLMDQYQANIKEKEEVIILLKEKIERLEKENILLERSS